MKIEETEIYKLLRKKGFSKKQFGEFNFDLYIIYNNVDQYVLITDFLQKEKRSFNIHISRIKLNDWNGKSYFELPHYLLSGKKYKRIRRN